MHDHPEAERLKIVPPRVGTLRGSSLGEIRRLRAGRPGSRAPAARNIARGTVRAGQEIRMSPGHDTAQDFGVDALLALAGTGEALSVEAVAPNRLNGGYALPRESGDD
ncbi:hypothetical protein GCM10010421_31420 [Streptomyces glaucus]|uniref:Uncharacterized protein n=1 Tax=Streptomyces glaucus TaxID=284029 RepID=A0ABN3JT79_9ACTN